MTKAEAYYFYKLNKLGIPISIRESEESGWLIKHYGLSVCQNAYEEEQNIILIPDNNFDECEIYHLMSLMQ